VPPHLAERILTSRSAVEGERKQVTVLFADLKSSMELLADRDPEEARRILDPVLTIMMDAVHRYEGTVNQVMGDGIMALFGAPLAHEDHAVRGCYAALRMQDTVARYADDLRRTHGLDVQIRVGLNSGDVLVRSIGSDLRMDYTAVGKTTHLAARMEQLARPGTVLLTKLTVRLTEGYVAVEPIGPIPVKGMSDPVEVYELVGVGPARTRLQAGAARGLTPFIGRGTELDVLQSALDRAGQGHGQVVALVGEPGVGKSRLFRELVHSHRTAGWLVLESGALPYGKATPYLPIVDLLHTYFELDDREDARRMREKLTGKLLTLDETLKATLPAFLTLLNVPVEEWRALDPPQRRIRTLDAIRRLFVRESHARPLVLVVEDLHWIDAESQAVLDGLVESLPAARLLLLVNYRPEYRHEWSGKSYYAQLRVDPLSAETAEALLDAVLGDGLDQVKRHLIERTEGNPFFLEESVRALVDGGVLAGERGRYRLTGEMTPFQIPSTVQAVLAARIDRLSPDDKTLLQAAAAIGKDVPIPVLRTVAGMGDVALATGLDRLRAAEFLYEATLFPEVEYTFKHALTHEVAYGGLLHERRRALHASIVGAIEQLYPDRLVEHIERLAHHAFAGEVWDRAVVYGRQAGGKTFTRSANREAVTFFEQALAALARLPQTRATVEEAIDVRFDLRNALFPLGEQARILECLREAEALGSAIDDQSRLARAASFMSTHHLAAGDHARAIEAGERALALAASLGDDTLRLTTAFSLAQVHLSRGQYRRASDYLRDNVTALSATTGTGSGGQSPFLVLSGMWLVWCLAELGEFTEGAARAGDAVERADAAGEPFDLLLSCLGRGLLHLRQGAFEDAIVTLERGLHLSRGGNLQVWFPSVASPLGYAYALSGRISEALPLLEEAVQQTATRGSGHALRMAHLGEAYLLAGRVAEAAELARRALDTARARREEGHVAYALRLVAEVAARRGGPGADEAESGFQEAGLLADALAMRPLRAHCHLGLGRLYLRTSRAALAASEIAEAVGLYRDMGMTFWLEQASGPE
jgi:class 3 adenylate cyclase/tetratricopeptide (TPR) repeat protein